MAPVNHPSLQAMAAEGAGDEAFKDFPEPYNRDFGAERYETFANWQKKGYISADSMTIKDADTPFYAGEAASEIGTLDDTTRILTNLKQYSPEAEYGFFVYAERVRNMQDGAVMTGFTSNNGLCVPAGSKKIDQTMKFLDWMFTDSANHDLFELGIEGTDWNPNYVRFSDMLSEEALKYRLWELKETSFQAAPVSGFNFDTSDVELSTTIAQVKTVTDRVTTVRLHGILNDGNQEYASAKEMLKANTDEAMKNGGEEIFKALETQINEIAACRRQRIPPAGFFFSEISGKAGENRRDLSGRELIIPKIIDINADFVK